MQLAWFTPLPPMLSGIADYSAELLPYLSANAEVTVFCPRRHGLRRVRAPRGIPIRDPAELLAGGGDPGPGGRKGSPPRFDAVYYHLGNNPYHQFVYESALSRPEIAVFHDAVLHHLIAGMTVEAGRDDVGRYEAILSSEYGQVGATLAKLRWFRLATDFEKFLFPVTGHLARRAKGIVVHSEDSAAKMREVAPGVPLAVIPHHAGEPPGEVAAVTREEARRRLGLPPSAFLVGHFGFVTRAKQPVAVLSGFEALHSEFPDSMLLMIGEDHTGGALNRHLAGLPSRDAIRREGYVDLERFYLYLKAVDAQVNLRYPSAGESSGTFARGLAEGRATIVNNYASFAEVPGDVALKVEIDGPQGEQVGRHLLNLASNEEFRRRIERNARAYARMVLDPRRCSDLYLQFAEEVARSQGATARRI